MRINKELIQLIIAVAAPLVKWYFDELKESKKQKLGKLKNSSLLDITSENLDRMLEKDLILKKDYNLIKKTLTKVNESAIIPK